MLLPIKCFGALWEDRRHLLAPYRKTHLKVKLQQGRRTELAAYISRTDGGTAEGANDKLRLTREGRQKEARAAPEFEVAPLRSGEEGGGRVNRHASLVGALPRGTPPHAPASSVNWDRSTVLLWHQRRATYELMSM